MNRKRCFKAEVILIQLSKAWKQQAKEKQNNRKDKNAIT